MGGSGALERGFDVGAVKDFDVHDGVAYKIQVDVSGAPQSNRAVPRAVRPIGLGCGIEPLAEVVSAVAPLKERQLRKGGGHFVLTRLGEELADLRAQVREYVCQQTWLDHAGSTR